MATTVTIGGADATDVQVASATSLTCVVPAGTAGDTVDVVVSTSGDTATLAGAYTYAPVPTATAISPTCVPTTGTAAMAVTGTGFTSGTTVTLAGPPNADITITDTTVVSDTEVTFTLTTQGQNQGPRQFTITTPGGSATTPTTALTSDVVINAVNPTSGAPAGGENVTINGSGFGFEDVTVMFGTTELTGTPSAGTFVTVVAPAGTAGDTVDISLTNCAGSTGTLTDAYTYAATPAVLDAIEPSTIAAGGPTLILASGYTAGAATLTLGSDDYPVNITSAYVSGGTGFLIGSPVTGDLAIGTYDVTLTDANGPSNTLTDGLTVADPADLPAVATITTVTPATVNPGDSVTLTGTGFVADDMSVYLWSSSGTYSICVVVDVVDTETGTFTVPAGVTFGGSFKVYPYTPAGPADISALPSYPLQIALVQQVTPAVAPTGTPVEFTATGINLDQYTDWGVVLDDDPGVPDDEPVTPTEVLSGTLGAVDETTATFTVTLPTEGIYNIVGTDPDGDTVILGVDLITGEVEDA